MNHTSRNASTPFYWNCFVTQECLKEIENHSQLARKLALACENIKRLRTVID